jgi:signal transduction histidine kinase
MVAMGEMIGNIAHQWRQPLSSISVCASGLHMENEFKTLTDEKIDKYVDSIMKSANYLSETIETFRNFIKGDKVKQNMILQEEIKKSLFIVVNTLDNKNIKLIDNIDYDSPLRVPLISNELPEVIINIINNSKDVLQEKKIQKPWIKLDLSHNKTHAIITIEDNGGGIPEDIIERIFEPYFTTKHESQGTGLGLHMSYRIITESLEGNLYVENTEDGAKFFIELPL